MAPPWPNFSHWSPAFKKSTPRHYVDRDKSSHPSDQRSHTHSEHNSVISSTDSANSHDDYDMNSGGGGYQRRGRGEYRARGGRGGHRTYSGSSGSSNGQQKAIRPVIRPSTVRQGFATLPKQGHQNPAEADTPLTPIREQSSFTMNGNTISETYTPRGSNATTPNPTRAYGPLSTPDRKHDDSGSPCRHLAQTPTTRNGDQNWAATQEFKIKLLGIPKNCWTNDIHRAMSHYGNVVRIEMQEGLRNNAWVTYQPPPRQGLPQHVFVGQAIAKWKQSRAFVRTIPSPVNPSKEHYEFNVLFANSVEFGTQDTSVSMIAMHTVKAHGNIQLLLNLDRKELDIQFPLSIYGKTRKYRFRLPIAHLSSIYKTAANATCQTSLVIPFNNPPQFFIQRYEGEILPSGGTHTSFSPREKTWIDWQSWCRETDVVSDKVKDAMRSMPLMNHKDAAIIDIGRWTSYRVSLDDTFFARPQYQDFANALADYGVEIKDNNTFTTKNRIASPLWTLLQEEISGTHPHLEFSSSRASGFNELFSNQIHLTFPVRYQLEACLSNGYLKEHTITTDFLEKLAEMEPCRAIHMLEKVFDKQQTYYDPMDIFKIRTKGGLERKVPSYCILQRSAIITPTMIHVASPIMETSNRITRKYAADADRFIRIKFSDEKTEGVLRSMPNYRGDAPFDKIRRAMKNGIIVAGRFYEFLAFGNSQFREHGAYFYAPTSSKSADDIRLSLGQFDHIKTVAKFGARIGQCFSTTRAMRTNVKVVEINDIERNGYCFTDGVGKLSSFLSQMAAQELGLSNAFDDPPSLFQFRLGGCKGVLALDPKLTGNEVHIRPSQLKFEAHWTGLEIVRSSALAIPFFNRQIIIVLSNLGVPDDVFVKKQQDMVNDYEQAMIDEEIAVKKLRKHIDMNQTTLAMAGMVLDGFMKTRDPFVMTLLKLWRASTIKNLKQKARIAIDDGAFLLGCVDETGILKGHLDDPQSKPEATRAEKLATLPEIFLRVDDTASGKKGHYKVVEGVCILARNPSLHPGDLRVVRAINIPELYHLKNVVVLPQTGDRDLANMCSGGDLDGDDYMVLWDSELIPETVNVPPMDFTAEKPIEKDGPITVADISDFFVTYMQNDSLGQIAHAHLAQADFHTESVLDETCLELAKLHSQAVDYPKSGIPAKMNWDLRPAKWPHYMEKKYVPERKIYRSKKVLGKLYDQVQLVDFKPQWENPFDDRVLQAFELDEATLAKAVEIKNSYDEALRRLMAKHGIRTEFEAWSVFVLKHNHESGDYKFAEEFGRTVGALKAQYKEICREAARVSAGVDCNHLAPFVAAMYTVTAQEMKAALEECRSAKIVAGHEVPARLKDLEHMPLISFPWLFANELGKIATKSTTFQREEPTTLQLPQRKKHAAVKNIDADLGTVETEEGITHYGELLKLNFGSQPTSADVLNAKEDGMSQPTNYLGVEGRVSSDDVARSTSLSPPVTESYYWKQGTTEMKRETSVDREAIEQQNDVQKETEYSAKGMAVQQEIEDNMMGVEVKLEKRKPSAIDRLKRVA